MDLIKRSWFYFFFLINLIFLSTCSKKYHNLPIDPFLQQAGENREEILSAYNYFSDKGDSLQLDALFFLLENMTDHSYSEIALYDTIKVEVEFNVLDYEDYAQALSSLDSLSVIYGDLNWRRKQKYCDHNTIKADLLIENIELAFTAWREIPWSRKYSYDNFKEYILPYRGSSEPLESWRSFFMSMFSNIESDMNDRNDPIEAAIIINQTIKKIFGFDPKFYLHPTDQGLKEMLNNKVGRCEDMTNFAIYALRANGIAVSSDYTPYWADSGNNHAWNVIITPEEESVPFMGCEADPGNYHLRSRMAKAYRKIFSSRPNDLSSQIENKENIPPWLSGDNFIDVTSNYTPVSDVLYKLNIEIPDSIDFAYLCVFNSGEWKAIQWGKIHDNEVVFKAMGTDLCYLPSMYINREIIQIGDPFILSNDNKMEFLDGNGDFQKHELYSVTKKIVKDATDNNRLSFLEADKNYEYYYWDAEWKLIGDQYASKDPLIFEEVPANRLYWLIEKDSRKEERIFTYKNDMQIWW